MAGNIRLEVVTPEASVVSENAQIVVAPGSLGEFGALIGHTPFLTTLKMGVLRYKAADGVEKSVFISSGFAEVLPGKVTVLAESAESRRDIDIERVKKAVKRAQERLASKKPDINYERAKASLQRALYRIRVAETKK
ncbi:MAG: F0F1 ATP synthase subunit epsilon [Thermodesulfobacteriota bacterium]|nr:F0F1 ATP synthase subunit epsilon [Thermodesulfobacteriota bacterium]